MPSTSERAAKTLLAICVQGTAAFLLARNARVKGKDGRTAWDRRLGKEFHGKLILFGLKVT